MRILATCLSAALYVLAFPPFGWSGLAFVALAPLALAVRGASPLRSAALGALWGWSTTVGVVAWLVPTAADYFERPLWLGVVFVAAIGAVALAPYAAIALALLAAARRRLGAAWPLAFALAFMAVDWARSGVGLASPWCKLGDALADWPRVIQIADLGGVHLVGGLAALVAAALAEALFALALALRARRLPAPPQRRRAALAIGCAAAALLAAVAYGERALARWATTPVQGHVLLVQGDVAPELRWRRSTASRVLRRYLSLTDAALRSRAGAPAPGATGPFDLIVWPENALQTSLDDPVYGPPVRALAARAGVPLLVGAPRVERGEGRSRHYNAAMLVRPDGTLEHYDKRRLLLFSERQPLAGWRGRDLEPARFEAGTRAGLFDLPARALQREADGARRRTRAAAAWSSATRDGSDAALRRFGVLICLEALDPGLAREAARAGAQLLVNLSNDGWARGSGAARQHLAQVVLRAVETRLPLLRATTTGISAAVGPDGRIAARIGAGERAALAVALPRGAQAPTPYVRTGDVLPPLAALGITALALPWRRRRHRRAPLALPASTPQP